MWFNYIIRFITLGYIFFAICCFNYLRAWKFEKY